MGNGRLLIGKPSGGVTTVTSVDGINNTEVVLPENGTLATTAGATETSTGLIELATTAEAQAGTDDTRAITPLKLKNSVLGLGQTLQTFTVGTQRVAGTTYTNTSGKPIEIYISGSSGSGGWNITLTINGTQVLLIGNTSNQGEGMCFSGIIPNGATYIVGSSGASISSWKELR